MRVETRPTYLPSSSVTTIAWMLCLRITRPASSSFESAFVQMGSGVITSETREYRLFMTIGAGTPHFSSTPAVSRGRGPNRAGTYVGVSSPSDL